MRRVAIGLACLLAAFAARSGTTPVDVNLPVANPRLSEAIRRATTERSDRAKDALVQELNRATYLALALDEPGYPSLGSPVGGQRLLPKGARFQFMLAGRAGKIYLMLFTDWDAVRAYTKRPVTGIVLPARDAWSLYTETLASACDGIVINSPFGALPLDKQRIESLSKAAAK